MSYKEAADFVMPWGKHRGRRLDEIAERDSGLLYLDWLRGQVESDPQPHKRAVREALSAYLSDELIASELRAIVNGDDS